MAEGIFPAVNLYSLIVIVWSSCLHEKPSRSKEDVSLLRLHSRVGWFSISKVAYWASLTTEKKDCSLSIFLQLNVTISTH